MLVTVAGLERFVGDIKRCYRGARISETPDVHHDAFAENMDGWRCVETGCVSVPSGDLVVRWGADPRTLVADMIQMPDGRISYRLYERVV